MSHKSEFRASVTNVAFILPVAGIAPIVRFDVGAPTGVAELGAGRSSTSIRSSDEGDDGGAKPDDGSFLFLFPFHFVIVFEPGKGGFGIDEEEDMKKRTMMPFGILS